MSVFIGVSFVSSLEDEVLKTIAEPNWFGLLVPSVSTRNTSPENNRDSKSKSDKRFLRSAPGKATKPS